MLRIVPALSEEDHLAGAEFVPRIRHDAGVEACLEDFERELASLPGRYAPSRRKAPAGNQESPETSGEAIGCAALRKLEPDACEMKRLYVRPAFRGQGAGAGTGERINCRSAIDWLPEDGPGHASFHGRGAQTLPNARIPRNSLPIRRTQSPERFSSSFIALSFSGACFSLWGLALQVQSPQAEACARPQSLNSFLSPMDLLHLPGQIEIIFRQAAGAVRAQIHRDLVPGIGPVRVMVHLFGGDRGPAS